MLTGQEETRKQISPCETAEQAENGEEHERIHFKMA